MNYLPKREDTPEEIEAHKLHSEWQSDTCTICWKKMPQKISLYLITNTVNRKVYIGQAKKPERRWSQHKSKGKYYTGSQVITKAMNKYGNDNFTFEIIAYCQNQEDTDLTEDVLIDQYDSRNPKIGYNRAPGGKVFAYVPRTPEMLKKISDSLRKFYATHESIRKGAVLPEEWKKKISESSMGNPGTNTGKTFSNEWAMKISKSQTGVAKISRRKFSEETEKEIIRLYVEEEKSTYAIGKQFECQRTTIADILNRNCIEQRKSNYTGHSNGLNIFSLEQELEICKIYEEGKVSRAKLAKQFNCGKTTVRDILLRHNIKL